MTHIFAIKPVLGIRISMFFILPDPHSDQLVRGTDTAPDPSIIKDVNVASKSNKPKNLQKIYS
jgi:hypothetical protein